MHHFAESSLTRMMNLSHSLQIVKVLDDILASALTDADLIK